jgi:hypothetical protein
MVTNKLKKGARVILKNGWCAEIEDNLKGNTRLATVHGLYTEMGSVYSHDMAWYQNEEGDDDTVTLIDAAGIAMTATFDKLPEDFAGTYLEIDHTPAQSKLRETIAAWDK